MSEKPLNSFNSVQRNAIITQCIAALPFLAFGNGILLAFARQLDLDGESTLRLLGVPSLIGALVGVPFAYCGDRFGCARLGRWGIYITTFGCAMLTIACIVVHKRLLLWLGVSIISVGVFTYAAIWQALVTPLIPTSIRARFWGRLRVSWQIVGIIFCLMASFLLESIGNIFTFALIWGFLALLQIPRSIVFRQIPDLNERLDGDARLWPLIKEIIFLPNYLPFCAYIFLLSLATGAVPWLFGLLQSKVMRLSDGDLVLLGNFLSFGSLGGFWLAGRIVDRWGAKSVFLSAHFCYALIIALSLMRDLFGLPDFAMMGIVMTFWGFAFAFLSIALTTETMALAPEKGRALGMTIISSFVFAGNALSAWAASAAISLGVFQERWQFLGASMSAYDGVLLLACFSVLALTVTLGLVPSVLQKSVCFPTFPR